MVERLRACHLAWGNKSHLTQALWQAPEPPGCFDVILAAGMLEGCIGTEEDASTLGPSSSTSSATVTQGGAGGIWDALVTARQLVEMHQGGRSLASISLSGGNTSISTTVGPSPAPGAFAVLLERRGVLPHARQLHNLDLALAGAGWALVQDNLPHELASWLAGPSPTEGCWRGPVAEHLDMILLQPSIV